MTSRSTGTTRRVAVAGILLLLAAGCSDNDGGRRDSLQGYPIDSEILTTQQRTVVPDPTGPQATALLPYEVAKYQASGYGTWRYGPGVATVKRLDLMPAAYRDGGVKATAQLLRFASVTDVHIADEESPVQAIYLGYRGRIPGAYSPVMMNTTQVLDAAVRTINGVAGSDPLDFVVSLGDSANDTQYNELRWYIDTLDGKRINPDSGVDDDPVPGPYNDYQDEFKAAGLDASIPWYQAMGNHDHLWIGAYPVNDRVRAAYTGTDILNLGNVLTDPAGMDSRGFYTGAIDGRTPNGDIIGVGPVADFATAPKVLAADPNRRSLTSKEWMNEFFTTSSKPLGHGFSRANVDNDFASYSFEPKSDVPIKIIVLDDTQSGAEASVGGYGHGYLDRARYDWLVNELDKGQAEGKLMIVAAHIPIGVEKPGSTLGWSSLAAVTEAQLIAKLHEYPNLLAWASGHRHRNTVTEFASPDPSRPELGFWQIETSSLREFPQQLRTFTIVRNSDTTISIFVTNVDTAARNGSLAAQSRSYAVATQQIFNIPKDNLPSGSYNAELVKQLSPQMQAKIQRYGSHVDAGSPSR